MTAVILSHIFVLGYGWFFVDALMVMLLAVIYLLLTRRQSYGGEPKSVGTTAAVRRPWRTIFELGFSTLPLLTLPRGVGHKGSKLRATPKMSFTVPRRTLLYA
jgi:hypothetical protein